jgi:hypothetical protein
MSASTILGRNLGESSGIPIAQLGLTAGAAKLGNPRTFPNPPRRSQPAYCVGKIAKTLKVCTL